MEISTLFLAFAISFAGSVPPGAVSLSLIQVGKTAGSKTTFYWSFLASVIETVQLILALWIHFQLTKIPDFNLYARPLAAVLLIGMGIHLLLKKQAIKENPILSFRAFVGLNVFNPMAIPFWLGALQLAMPSHNSTFSFVIGSFIGAWLCLAIYGLIGSGLKNIQSLSQTVLNRGIGWTMIVLAAWQSVLFFKAFFTSSHSIYNHLFSQL